MKRSRFAQLFCAVLLLTAMLLPVHADTGPKPSVVIEVQGLEGRACWVTLLSDTWSTGPHSSMYRADEKGELQRVEAITPDHVPGDEAYPAWKAFSDYAQETFQTESLYFLGYIMNAVGDDSFSWGYYPPSRFKVALYFPETDSLLVTGAFYDRYAFDSYYAVDVSKPQLIPGGVTTGAEAVVSYDFTWEPVALAFRMVLTIAVELLIARKLFGLRGRKRTAWILGVNLVTQLLLNLGLNYYVYFRGSVPLQTYAMMEAAVLAVEGVIYHRKLLEQKDFGLVFSYAMTANLASFGVGWALSHVLPGLF